MPISIFSPVQIIMTHPLGIHLGHESTKLQNLVILKKKIEKGKMTRQKKMKEVHLRNHKTTKNGLMNLKKKRMEKWMQMGKKKKESMEKKKKKK